MVKEVHSFEEQMQMLLNGTDFATYLANSDIKKYAKFKSGEEQDLSKEDSMSMKILSILERLGYPMDELGTYLYKEMIAELCNSLVGVSSRREIDKCRTLLAQVNDAFSQFYINVARENLDIGLQSFHLYIQKAIEKINAEQIDLSLSYEIFDANPGEQTYANIAFQIAAYILGYKMEKEVHPPVIIGLPNMTEDVALKNK